MRRFSGRARFGNVSLSDAPAVTFAVHFQDRGVVNKSIDRRDRHGCVDEDVAPFRERRVCGDGDALALVAFSDEFEEDGGFSLVLADVANIVEDQEIEAIKACNFVRETKIPAGNLKALYEVATANKENAFACVDECVADSVKQMTLTAAWRAKRQYVRTVCKPIVLVGERGDLRFGDCRDGGKVEGTQILVDVKTRLRSMTIEATDFALCHFLFEEML